MSIKELDSIVNEYSSRAVKLWWKWFEESKYSEEIKNSIRLNKELVNTIVDMSWCVFSASEGRKLNHALMDEFSKRYDEKETP